MYSREFSIVQRTAHILQHETQNEICTDDDREDDAKHNYLHVHPFLFFKFIEFEYDPFF